MLLVWLKVQVREGLGNKFLANIRKRCNYTCVKMFENDNIVHVDGSVDPIRDKETIDMELQLKDLESVEKSCRSMRKCLELVIKKLEK